MRIAADRDLCIGAGMCVVNAPAVFDQDEDDGLVMVLVDEPDGPDAAAAGKAVGLCPSGALRVVGG
jgi:ferredoxin